MVPWQQYSWSMGVAWGALRRDLLLRMRVLALVLTLPSHCGQRNLMSPFLSGLPMGVHRYLARSAYQSASASPGQVLGWDPEVFGCPLDEEGAAVEQKHLCFVPVFYLDYLDYLFVAFGVVHDHVHTHLVEGPHEGFSVVGVAHVGDDFFEVGEGFEGDEDRVEAVESVVVLGGNGSAVGNVLGWARPRSGVVANCPPTTAVTWDSVVSRQCHPRRFDKDLQEGTVVAMLWVG